MSTNIKVQRICQFCGKEFTARTTVTQFCGDNCAKRGYKARIRAQKIETSNKEIKQAKAQPLEEIKAKEFLTVKDVAKLLNSSLPTVYRLINMGTIKGVNLAQRKTIIKRSEIDKFFVQFPVEPNTTEIESEDDDVEFDENDWYNLTEVQKKYGISEGALQSLIKRNKIPKIKKGWFAYVPKQLIDNILTQ